MLNKRMSFLPKLPGGTLIVLMLCMMPLLLAACGVDNSGGIAVPAITATTGSAGSAGCTVSSGSPGGKYMIIETSKGCIIAKLHTEASAGVSNTIANFEQKANSGYFNGRIFHRVEDWVIQGGDPLGNGTGGNRMPSEYNNLPFNAGALGVARGQDPAQNNDSQFFILKSPAPHLNGQYTNWGQVVEGIDVVNNIAIGDQITRVTVSNQK